MREYQPVRLMRVYHRTTKWESRQSPRLALLQRATSAGRACPTEPADLSPFFRVVQGSDREPCLHPITDGVADDPVRIEVLDRAHRYSLPSAVGCSVMSASHTWFGPAAVKFRLTRSSWDGGTDLGLLAALLLAEHAPPAVGRADPPHGPLGSLEPGVADFIGQEPVANSGSSRWASNRALASNASSRSASVTGQASHR